MAEITHADLDAFGQRLERQIDRSHAELKDDVRAVHARVTEIRDRVGQQNGRIDRSEQSIARIDKDIAVLGATQSTAAALPTAVQAALRRWSWPKLVAIGIGALAGLSGASEGWHALGTVLRQLLMP